MITLLGRLRRSLIQTNKSKTYILYAIGEIGLVVIGILIALQINNWNEERKARISELNALIELREEFKDNKERLLLLHNWKKEVVLLWRDFMDIVSDFTLPESERAITRPTNGARQYRVSNSALNGILNSDRFENIENDSLKYFLTQWVTEHNLYDEVQQRHTYFVENALKGYEFGRRIQTSQSHSGTEYVNPFLKHYTQQEIIDLYSAAYDDLAYQNMLFMNVMWLDIAITRGETLLDKIERIIQLTNLEIESKQD